MRLWITASFIVLVSLLALRADDDKGPPEGWKEVSGGFKKQAYTVWMPKDGKITDDESSIVSKLGQIRVFRTVCVRKNGMLFAAGQINLPPNLTKAPAKQRQELLRDMFLEEVKGKLTDEKKVTLGTMSGKEYVADTPQGVARYRLYGTGVKMFRVLVVGTKKQMESKDVDTFLDSLKRTPVGSAGSGSASGSSSK